MQKLYWHAADVCSYAGAVADFILYSWEGSVEENIISHIETQYALERLWIICLSKWKENLMVFLLERQHFILIHELNVQILVLLRHRPPTLGTDQNTVFLV